MKLRELEKRLKLEPDNLGLRVTVAGLLREANRSVEAVELYRSVAVEYRQQGRNQQAIAVCRSILEIAPDDIACHALLASLVANQPGRAARDTAEQVPPLEIVVDPGTPPPEPARRSSLQETPLPRAVPYHVADPTTSSQRLSPREISGEPSVEGAETRPGGEERREGDSGLALAARRISGLIAGNELDLAAELETRQRPRVDADELRKISQPPPTVPVSRVELDDRPTPPSRATPLELTTDRQDAVTPAPRDSDDEVTQPRERPLTGNDEV